MYSNLQPRKQSNQKSSLTHHKSIVNHLRQIGAMVNNNGQSRFTNGRNVTNNQQYKTNINNNNNIINRRSEQIDDNDDYLDDYIMGESSSSDYQSDQQSDIRGDIRIPVEKINRERGASSSEINSLIVIKLNKQIIEDYSCSTVRKQQYTEGEQRKQSQIMEKQIKEQKQIGNCCAICLENWREGDQILLIPCLHKFHEICMKDWLIQKNKCPCCNATIFV